MSTWNPKANEIFLNARELTSDATRADFLADACGDDQQLWSEVKTLLSFDSDSSDFLEVPAIAALTEPTPIAKQGDVIGHYTLIEQLGAGGMGVVFKAEQSVPVRRTVALKIIRVGVDSHQMLARFEIERQALAMMDHPNISKVLDAGQTNGGLPYFVMELVLGLPITTYCDQHHLSVRERLSLFVPVCKAIQHAHQKGIIHRDLKPSNVIVADSAESPIPKVIDFGVAKSTGPKLSDHTMHTAQGTILGTLEYMSPEQAELNPLEVDTRSDVYSLGVLLYELFTGITPFRRNQVQVKSLLDALQRIHEHEPMPPSRCLDTSHDSIVVAINRRSEVRKLVQSLRGELDWVVMKALQKRRMDRYQTVSELLRDVECYLADLPVTARPISTTNRVWRWCRKNPYLAGSSALAMFLLIVLATGASIAAIRLNRMNQTVVRAEQQAYRAERARREELVRAYVNRAASTSIGESQIGTDAIRAALSAIPWQKLSAEDQRAMIDAAIPCLITPQLREVSRRTGLAARQSNRLLGVDVDPQLSRVVSSAGQDEVTLLKQLDGSAPPQRFVNPNRVDLATPSVRMFSPDGRRLLEISYRFGSEPDQGFSVWDVETGRLCFQHVQEGTVEAPTFHPDGKHLLIQDPADRTLNQYSIETGKRVAKSPTGFRAVRTSYSSDGKYLAIAGTELPAEVVDAETWESLATFPEQGPIASIVWQPHAPVVVLGGSDGNLCRWNINEKNVPTRLPIGHQHGVHRLVFSPDGKLLASSESDSGRRYVVRRLADNQILATGTGCVLKFSPDGRRFAVLDIDNLVIYEILESTNYRRLDLAADSATFSADNHSLAIAGVHGVQLIDPLTFQLQANLGLDRCGPVAFHPAGKMLTTFGYFSQVWNWPISAESIGPPQKVTLRVENAAGLEPQHQGRYTSWSPDGQYLAVGNYRYSVALVWDSATQTAAELIADKSAIQVAISQDNRWLVFNSRNDGHVFIRSRLTSKPFEKMIPGAAFALSPDGRSLSVRTEVGIDVYSGLDWRDVHSIPLPTSLEERFVPPVYQPHGEILAVGNAGQVKLLHRDSGEQIATLTDHDHEAVRWLSFSPDGNQLAVTRSSNVNLWNLADLSFRLRELGLPVQHLRSHWNAASQDDTRSKPTTLKVDRGELPAADRWYELWMRLALSESLQDNFPDAIDDVNRAWEQVPNDAAIKARLMARRGVYYRRNLNPDLAERDWASALGWDQDEPTALAGLAQLYAIGPPPIRDPKKAISMAALLTNGAKTKTFGQLLSAIARVQLGIDAAEGRPLLDAILSGANSDVSYDWRLAAGYFLCLDQINAGDRAAADKSFDTTIALHQDLPSSLQAFDRIDLDRLQAEVRQRLDRSPSKN